MLVARWQIDAKFGHKQNVIDLMRQWEQDIGSKAGTGKMDFKLLTGSVGVREATIEANHTVENLAQLERFFEALSTIDAHKQWVRTLSPTWCQVRHTGTSTASSEI